MGHRLRDESPPQKCQPLEGPPPVKTPCRPVLMLGIPDWVILELDQVLINDLVFSSNSRFQFPAVGPTNVDSSIIKLKILQYLDGQSLLKLNKICGGTVILREDDVFDKETEDVDMNRLKELSNQGPYQAIIVDDTCFMHEPAIHQFVHSQYHDGHVSVVVLALEGIYIMRDIHKTARVDWKLVAYTRRTVQLSSVGKAIIGNNAFAVGRIYTKAHFIVAGEQSELFEEYIDPRDYEYSDDESYEPDSPPQPDPGSPVVVKIANTKGDDSSRKSFSYFGFVNTDVPYGSIMLRLCYAAQHHHLSIPNHRKGSRTIDPARENTVEEDTKEINESSRKKNNKMTVYPFQKRKIWNTEADEALLWNDETDGGPILDAFVKQSFQPLKEYDGIALVTNHKENKGSIKFGFEGRIMVIRIVEALTQSDNEGVILSNQAGTKFLAIEYCTSQKDSKNRPLLEIRLGIGQTIDQAKTFLRGLHIQAIECSNQTHKLVEEHLLKKCENLALEYDISRCLFYSGHLAPMKPEQEINDIVVLDTLLNDCLNIQNENFGVEFEVSCAAMVEPEKVVESIRLQAGVQVANKFHDPQNDPDIFYDPFNLTSFHPNGMQQWSKDDKDTYWDHFGPPDKDNKAYPDSKNSKSSGGRGLHQWKVVYDSSIQANRGFAMNTKFELVSPILRGKAGLSECVSVLEALNNTSATQVNSSMGMHVHIDVEKLSLPQLIRVCQVFVQYEDTIDTFMDPSRRTGSSESKKYFDSNKNAVMGDHARNLQRLEKLESCRHKFELCNVMNPKGRYYKLNLQNLKTGRQPTLEFRQHAATSDSYRVASWVRFCLALVYNAAQMKDEAPSSTDRMTRKRNDDFQSLFESIIQDESLCNFYKKQREILNRQEGDPSMR